MPCNYPPQEIGLDGIEILANLGMRYNYAQFVSGGVLLEAWSLLSTGSQASEIVNQGGPMKSRWTLILGVGLLLLISACNSAPASPEVPTTPANATQGVVTTTYPGPGQAGSSNAYPEPTVITTTQSQSGSLYPSPKSGDTISWEQATALIKNQEVESLSETGTKVVLNLKDGRSLSTNETASGEIISFLQNCGDQCKDIKVNPSQ